MTKKTSEVYNLEFPIWCRELSIAGYRFLRIENYENHLRSLNHISGRIAEFNIPANTGSHAVTALVELPENEPNATLQWADNNATSIQDILFLLSIFTGRDVFVINEDETTTNQMQPIVLVADPRQYIWGETLRCSIPYEGQNIDPEPYQFNIGFEKGINQIYKLINRKNWQNKYKGGFFLFLFRAAIRRQLLESSFIQCWTIWEHIFCILNENWMSAEQIRKTSSVEKISFILVNFALTGKVDKTSRQKIQELSNIRNRLIHFGKFPEQDSVKKDAELFIRITEFVIAKILGLAPSNIFNTFERLEDFLGEGQSKQISQ